MAPEERLQRVEVAEPFVRRLGARVIVARRFGVPLVPERGVAQRGALVGFGHHGRVVVVVVVVVVVFFRDVFFLWLDKPVR